MWRASMNIKLAAQATCLAAFSAIRRCWFISEQLMPVAVVAMAGLAYGKDYWPMGSAWAKVVCRS